MENTKQAALEWANNGKLCTYRYGLAYRGAKAKVISQEEALKRLSNERGWSFGMGFYALCWSKYEGEPCLEFNELRENDLL